MLAALPASNDVQEIREFYQDQLKLGLKASKKLGSKASKKLGLKTSKQQVSNLFAWTEKAQKAISEKLSSDGVVQEDGPDDTELRDVEMREGSAWSSMTKAASVAKGKVAKAAEDYNPMRKNHDVERTTSGNSATSLHDTSQATSWTAEKLTTKVQDKPSVAPIAGGWAGVEMLNTKPSLASSKSSEIDQTVTPMLGKDSSLSKNAIRMAQFFGVLFILLDILLLYPFNSKLIISPGRFALFLAFGFLSVMSLVASPAGQKILAPQPMQTEKPPFEV